MPTEFPSPDDDGRPDEPLAICRQSSRRRRTSRRNPCHMPTEFPTSTDVPTNPSPYADRVPDVDGRLDEPLAICRQSSRRRRTSRRTPRHMPTEFPTSTDVPTNPSPYADRVPDVD